MWQLERCGVIHGKVVRPTVSNKALTCSQVRVNRPFRAIQPNALPEKKGGTHHSDRGAQSVLLCYTPRLKEAGIAPSRALAIRTPMRWLNHQRIEPSRAASPPRRAEPEAGSVGNSELGALGYPSARAGGDRLAITRPSRHSE